MIEQRGLTYYYFDKGRDRPLCHERIRAMLNECRSPADISTAAGLLRAGLAREGCSLDFDPDTIRIDGQHADRWAADCVAFELRKPEPVKKPEEEEAPYLLVREKLSGGVVVKSYTAAGLTAWLDEFGSRRTFVRAGEEGSLSGWGRPDTMIIKGEIVVPREKAVVREYEVD